jgi:AraC family transcriptional regulator
MPEPKIRELDSFRVVGLRRRFDHETRREIPALWDRFIPRIAEVRHTRADGITYGIVLNVDSRTGEFDYIAGIGVERAEDLPQGMESEIVPHQRYAVFTHVLGGRPLNDEMSELLAWIWGTWLPASPYAPATGAELERYPADFDPSRAGCSIEICIPIRPRSRL